MAAAAATAGLRVAGNGFLGQQKKKSTRSDRTMKVSCVASRMDPYKTLRIDHGASESEVRKAFRKLALKYHPDVCKGNNCGVQFHEINEAYNVALHNVRNNIRYAEPEPVRQEEESYMYYDDEQPWDEWSSGWGEAAAYPDVESRQQAYIYDEEDLSNLREEWKAWKEVSYGNTAGAY